MGAGGSGASGTGGGGYSGGGLANTGGTGWGSDRGAQGTAGEMSAGAGGAAMAGFGNTGAGGSGMAGISSHDGMTPAGFTPAYGDPRGLSVGMAPNGTYPNGFGHVQSTSTAGPQGLWHDKQQNTYVAQTVWRKGEPVTTYVKINDAIPTSVNPMHNAFYGRAMNKFGQTITRNSGPGLPPGLDPKNQGIMHSGYNQSIGPQNPNGYTGFGPNSYGNSGLMNNNGFLGGSLSTGLGSRMASTGYTGGVSRTQGNVLGQGENMGYGGAGYVSGSRGSGGLTGNTGGNAAGGPGAGRSNGHNL